MKKKIGIIGVGLMGHGIASNIVGKGWPMAFLDHPGNQPTQDLLDKGALAFHDVRELAQNSDVMVLCVSGPSQVEAIMTGDTGILPVLRPDTTVIDCSTAIPASTERLALAVEAAGGHFIDAAMTRTPGRG